MIGFCAWAIIGVGFILKDSASSILAGISLVIDQPFQVGDRITFKKIHGDVLSIGLRSVKVLTADDSVVTIPNQNFTSEIVSSNSAGEFGMATTVDIYLKSTANLMKADKLLKQAAAENNYIDKRQPVTVQLSEKFNDNEVTFLATVKCVLKDARTEREFQTNFLLAANKALRAHKIR